MMEALHVRSEKRSKLWIAALVLTILVSIVVIPPLVSINRYKSRIARAMSSSLGRPVHMSAVELRVLPRPGFLITDLTVEEDNAYGAEPVLHAGTVAVAIRLMSLWRGRLVISRISVDEASLNLVRTLNGRWNLDTLFRTAAQSEVSAPGRGRSLPYLEATNSRINVKQGVEKLPYSLVGADLSFWEEDPGDWRVRLKGQPVRTDVSLQQGDTGIVQLEGRMRRASELRWMPVHIDVEWRNAQLGQLSRLLIGSDAGWRGDLTAEMKLDGIPDSAEVTARLKAIGVHREEFAPAAPLDFDANCAFAYHYSARTVDKLICDSPLGDGRMRLEGNLPAGAQPKLSLELQKIPAQAVLDALRTMRQELGVGLEAEGTLTGKLNYDATAQVAEAAAKQSPRLKKNGAKGPAPVVADPVSGSITLDALKLSGGSLNEPVQIAKVLFEPAAGTNGQNDALAGTATLPAGALTPLVVALRLAPSGYQVSAHGTGSSQRLRQLAHAAGLKEAGALDAIEGDPVTLNLAIEGPWLPVPDAAFKLAESSMAASPADATATTIPSTVPDRLTGTVTVHNANWKTDLLPAAVKITQATLHLMGGKSTWDPVAFEYGTLRGTAKVELPLCSAAEQPCTPAVNLELPYVDASELQTTLLGAEKKGTLLSTMIARLTPTSTHTWPAFQGTVKVASVALGPVTLQDLNADVKVGATEAEITSMDAGFLGGQLHVSGKVENGAKPVYSLEGSFAKLSASEFCEMLALKCTGAGLDGKGSLNLAGFAGKDLAGSAKGIVHFDWRKGTVTGLSADAIPEALSRFDSFSGDAEIANGGAALKENVIQQGPHKATANATIKFGEPPTVVFVPSRNAALKNK